DVDVRSGPRNATRGALSACCARAAIGQPIAALPRRLMNSRRLIASPEARDKASCGINVAHWKSCRGGKPMSALGHKQTYAAQHGMSALAPKATSNATDGMSAKGQKRTISHLPVRHTDMPGMIMSRCRGRGQREQTLPELLVVDCVQPCQIRGARKGRKRNVDVPPISSPG